MSPIPVSKSADFSEWKEGFFLPLTFPFAFLYIFSLQPSRQGRGVRHRTPFTFSKHREVTKINHGNLSCLPSSLSLVRKRKERLPASLPTYIFTFSCFVLLNQKEGLPPVFPRLPAHYYEFLSLLFCCLHSSQKCERCGGHPFHFVSSGEIPNCRRLSLLVFVLCSYREWR